MIFEIIDLDTGNVLGAYDTEELALRFVKGISQVNSVELMASVALLREDTAGQITVLAEGQALLERAGSLAA